MTLPRFQITNWTCSPVQNLLTRLQVNTLTMGQLAGEPIQYLMESISRLSRLWEQHCLLHCRIRQQSLLPQYHLWGYGCEDCVQVGDILLIHKYTNFLPRNSICERQHNVICDDHRYAPEYHCFDQSRAPRSPPQRTQAENGPLHVFVVSCRMVRGDVEERIVLEILPHRCPCTSLRSNIKNKVKQSEHNLTST